MKKLIYLFLILIALANASCKKNTKILYPSITINGENILAKADGAILDNGKSYSFAAKLAKKSKLKIVITNLSPSVTTSPQSTWFYYLQSNNGWLVRDYDSNDGTQTFTAIKTGDIDLKIEFDEFTTTGTCKVEFYENDKLSHTNRYSW